MKLRTYCLLATALCGVISLGPQAIAGTEPRLVVTDTRLRLEGDSTLHPYASRTRDLRIVASLAPGKAKAGSLEDLLAAGHLAALEVTIPVKSLKSGEGLLDTNLYRALEADRHPHIRFRLTRYKARPTGNGDITVRAEGTLSVAGTERDVSLEARGDVSGGKVCLAGSYDLLMSDYGVRPPVLMLGAIKVKDRISIHYELLGEIPETVSGR
ncbi:MAG: YceI family protein [Candidatus Sericytochromatia bacterium]|nr:YceI family protein [Candidatus Tanganyikabacteria bacterium]